MVVYQALKRLTGFSQVATVLDDSKYHTWKRECRYSDEESESDDEAGNAYASRTTLGKFLVASTLWEDFDCYEGELPDPESVTHVRHRSDSKRLREQTYSRQNVTWLNYSPHSKAFRELAFAFPTVSFVIMNLSRRVRFSINCFPVVRK